MTSRATSDLMVVGSALSLFVHAYAGEGGHPRRPPAESNLVQYHSLRDTSNEWITLLSTRGSKSDDEYRYGCKVLQGRMTTVMTSGP